MTNYDDNQPNSGPKTKASKGQRKHKQLNVTIPAELANNLHEIYKELRSIQPTISLSQFVTHVLEIGLEEI